MKQCSLLFYLQENRARLLASVDRLALSMGALGCFNHIERIFAELEEILPFEILRSSRDKANYLLLKEARIIAMTSTHAAIKVYSYQMRGLVKIYLTLT